jgi:hypothetical protein
MEFPRILLSVLAALAGIALLIVAAWRSVSPGPAPSRRSRGGAYWIYGLLFIGAAAVLWWRDSELTPRAPAPSAEQHIRESPPVPTHTDSVAKTEIQAETGEKEAAVHRPIPSSAVGMRPARRPVLLAAPVPLHATATGPVPRRELDEYVYHAVSRAFDLIEDLFLRYGTVVREHSVHAASLESLLARPLDDFDFPTIQFESGTADLQPQSRLALKNLAARLRALTAPATLEIEARVESGGIEPFNFILTQARAEVVREALVEEGVDTRWLVARGGGSQSGEARPAESQIRFVLHP